MRFPFGRNDRQVGGFSKAHGLSDWWFKTLSEPERELLAKVYEPFGLGLPASGKGRRCLVEGEFGSASSSNCSFVSTLATWVNKPKTRELAKKVVLESLNFDGSVLDRHFREQHIIQIFYPDRDKDPNALPIVIGACTRQIALSKEAARVFSKQKMNLPKGVKLPTHVGFEQLAIILEKQGKFSEALELNRRALREGWNGTWPKRIERLEKKLKSGRPQRI